MVIRLLLLWSLLAPLLMHEPARPPDADRPQLVRDTPFQENEPRRFRTSAELADAYRGDDTGLAELRCSGSATLSDGSLAWILTRIPRGAVIVDLRQESHGLLNGAAVSWEAESNWANVGHPQQEVLAREKARLEELARTPRVSLPFERTPEAPPEEVAVERVASEQELVEKQGCGYFRVTVSDHLRPADPDVDRFVAFVDELAPGTWLHFHCRAGVGRTTTFMAMYDMLRNAQQVAFDEILSRQAALPPNFELLEIKPTARELYSQERADFIHWFYRFAQERQGREKWSEWLARQ
jgi:protein-tyrosine phosphatase